MLLRLGFYHLKKYFWKIVGNAWWYRKNCVVLQPENHQSIIKSKKKWRTKASLNMVWRGMSLAETVMCGLWDYVSKTKALERVRKHAFTLCSLLRSLTYWHKGLFMIGNSTRKFSLWCFKACAAAWCLMTLVPPKDTGLICVIYICVWQNDDDDEKFE